MSDLGHLAFDVFLSYGWAGIPGQDDGDRGWVAEFKRLFEQQLSSALGRKSRVHLDVEQPTNGELPANLRDRLAGSAIFLSVITKGSVKAEGWCRRELDWFLGDAPGVLDGRRQIYSLLLRPVDKELWPDALQLIAPTSFVVSEGATTIPVAREDLADERTEAGRDLRVLAAQVAATLESIEKEIARTVVVAGAGSGIDALIDRLRVEITKRRGAVVRVAPEAGENEALYVRRVTRALNGASLLVYLDGDGPAITPAGWSRTVEQVEMAAGAGRFGADARPIIVWRTGSSAGASEWTSAQVLKDLGFEYLHTLLCQTLETNVTTAAARVASRKEAPEVVTPVPVQRYVFVECVESDLQRLLPLRNAFRDKGFIVKFPLFQGDPDMRRLVDLKFLLRCDAAAVYFGSRNDLEAFLACQSLADCLADHAVSIPRAVLLDPPSDPVRQGFVFPDFVNRPYEPDEFVTAITGAAS